MDEGVIKLYKKLGYSGSLPVAGASPSDQVFSSLAPSPSFGGTAPLVDESMRGVNQVAVKSESADVSPLGPKSRDEFEVRLNTDSEETLARAQAAIDRRVIEAELRANIARTRLAFRSPETAIALVNAKEDVYIEAASASLSEFEFDYLDLEQIPVDSASKKFETVGNALGWTTSSKALHSCSGSHLRITLAYSQASPLMTTTAGATSRSERVRIFV